MSTNALRNDEHKPTHIMTTTVQTISAHTNRLQPTSNSTDDGSALVTKEGMAGVGRTPSQKVDKQSAEYLIKSGVAGGLAGCAVMLSILHTVIKLYI
jgi:hypothetical protein